MVLLRITIFKEITPIALAPSSKVFIISICLEYRNVFTMLGEIPSVTLLDIKETDYTKTIKNYKGK